MPRPRTFLLPSVLCALLGARHASAAETWPPAGSWPTSTPEEQGLDSEKLAAMTAFLGDQGYSVEGVLLVRHGHLVLEAYGRPFGPDVPHLAYSIAKSFVSTLVGIAIQDGAIAGVDQELGSIFAEDELDPSMRKRTLRDVMTMTSGIGEPGPAPAGMDWLRHALRTPAIRERGTFTYSNTSSHLVLTAVARATGTAGPDLLQQKLFGPLGMGPVDFGTNGSGVRDGGDRLSIRPRDLARFGLLFLRKGEWNGRRILPAAWVEASTSKLVDTAGNDLGKHGYGLFWWREETGYAAMGYAGQYVFVVPDRDLVAVFTGNMAQDFQVPREMMKAFVLPSIRSEGPLPPNAEALARLRAAIEQLY
jgi:CubicO group peptidase (beta-lactamase class C family)